MSLFHVYKTSLLNNSAAYSNAYVLWKAGKAEENASLEFYQENLPFKGNVNHT
jgi:hypothetical protein